MIDDDRWFVHQFLGVIFQKFLQQNPAKLESCDFAKLQNHNFPKKKFSTLLLFRLNVLFLSCHNAVLMLWLCLSTITTWVYMVQLFFP